MRGRAISRVVTGGLLLIAVGCGLSPTPRWMDVLGTSSQAVERAREQGARSSWPTGRGLGLAVLADATGAGAADPISASMRSLLAARTAEYLATHCPSTTVSVLEPFGGREPDTLRAVRERARVHGVADVLVVLFSGVETTEPASFGEERMMTQMPGTTTHHEAVAELGLLNVEEATVRRYVARMATESADRLDVPLGEGALSVEDTLDRLRANAAQQALDEALVPVTVGCEAAS